MTKNNFLRLKNNQSKKKMIFYLLIISYYFLCCNCNPNCSLASLALSTNNLCYGLHYNEFGSITSCKVPGTIALTFDDGPGEYSSYILDQLKQYNFKATFFTVGYKISENKNIVQREIDEGHQVASLSYSHQNFTLMNTSDIIEDAKLYEINFVNQKFNNINSNFVPQCIRSPYDKINESIMETLNNLNYTVVSFTIDSLSTYFPNDPNIVMETYQDSLGGPNAYGINMSSLSIITTQQDITFSTAISIPNLFLWIEDNFVSKGVRLVTIAECLQIEMYKPINQEFFQSEQSSSATTNLFILWLLLGIFFGLLLVCLVWYIIRRGNQK